MLAHDDSALLHGGAYDPTRAHEYYMRTRHLKGRQTGSAQPSNHGSSNGHAPSPQQKRHAQLEAQKKALEARLDHLKNVLSDLVNAAKARSGIKAPANQPNTSTTTTPTDTAAKNHNAKKSVPLTAAQKREKAKQAHEAYVKANPSLPKELQDLQSQIQDIHKKIMAAVEEARRNHAKSNHQTA